MLKHNKERRPNFDLLSFPGMELYSYHPIVVPNRFLFSRGVPVEVLVVGPLTVYLVVVLGGLSVVFGMCPSGNCFIEVVFVCRVLQVIRIRICRVIDRVVVVLF